MRNRCVAWLLGLLAAGTALPASVTRAQSMITGPVVLLRIDTAGNDNAARVQLANHSGCSGFYNVSLAEATFPQMVAVLQTALVTAKPVTLVVDAGCRIASVTISAN